MVNQVKPVSRAQPGVRSLKTRPDRTVGHILQQARQRRGVSLRTVANTIKVPHKHLAALEAGDLSVFRAEVYARGAFTKYAQYLGIHTDHTHHAFQRIAAGAREFVPLRVHTPQPWLAATMTPRRVLAAAIAAAGIILSSYVAWQVSSFFRLPPITLLEPATAVVTSDQVTVRGHAAADAAITVNGREVVADSDGIFTTDLNLHPGINPLQITATNAAGRTRVVQRDILVPRNELRK